MSDIYLWETYDKIGHDAVDRHDYPAAVEAFKAAVALAEELVGENRKLITSLIDLSAATAKTGQLSFAFEVLEKTKEIAQERIGKKAEETQLVLRKLYEMSRELGFLDKAEAYLIDLAAIEKDDGQTEKFLNTLELLAQLATEREQWDNAISIYQEIIEANQALYEKSQPGLTPIILKYAMALSKGARYEESQQSLAKAIALLEEQFQNEPDKLAQSLMAAAELIKANQDYEYALDLQKRALDLYRSSLGEDHELIWQTRENIAFSLAALGKTVEAIELLEFCLANGKQTADHHQGATIKNLAALYLTMDNIDKAQKFYHEARKLFINTLGSDHPITLAAIEEEVQLLYHNGKAKEALELALTTISATETRYGPGHPNTAQAYIQTALLAHASRQWETAYELMKAAKAIWETITPKRQDVLNNCSLNLATCLLELGRHQEALNFIDEIIQTPNSLHGELIQSLREQALANLAPVDPVSDSSIIKIELNIEEEPDEVREPEALIKPIELRLERDPAPTPATFTSSSTSATGLEELEMSEAISFTEASDIQKPAENQNAEGYQPLQEDTAKQDKEPYQEERRANRRSNLGLNRFFDLALKNTKEELFVIQSFLVDLSLGGMRVNTELPLPQEEDFKLTIPTGLLDEELTIAGKVVWQRALFGFSFIQGLKFVELSPIQHELIENFLKASKLPEKGRQHYRLYRPFPIEIVSSSESQWFQSYASDLSLEGLGTRLEVPLAVGDLVKIRLNLDFELPTVEVEGQVAWSRGAENGVSHGLKFKEVGRLEARTIKLFMEHCLELSPE